MKRALVLNSGASWAAYQIGALRHLIIDRELYFDLCAGTGIGAMNAAFVGCNEFTALEAFWKRIGIGKLVRLNWRTPWREGPCTSEPQRRFIAAHVSEEKLAKYGVTLLVSTFNLQTGQEQVMRYPGCDLPLVDALMAAVATPGLCPPVLYRDQQLAEGTLITSFLLHKVLQYPVEEIIAVAPVALRDGESKRRFTTWHAVLERALAINQAHDVWSALAEGEHVATAAAAFRHVSEQLPALMAERIPDPALREQLLAKVSDIYCHSAFTWKRVSGPVVKAITPSLDLTFPIWRFRQSELAAAKALGYQDARRVLGMEVDE